MEEKKVKVSNYLVDDMIFLNQNFSSTDELFETVAKKGLEKGFVTDQFLPKIKQRESTFPTGLQLEDRGVAIPHTDADTIKKEFVAVITNQQAISFKRMDDPNEIVAAKLVFVLGLNKPHAQLDMLQALMALIQDKEILDKLQDAQTIVEVKNLFD